MKPVDRCEVGQLVNDRCARPAAWFVETVTGDFWVCEECCIEHSLEDRRSLDEEPS